MDPRQIAALSLAFLPALAAPGPHRPTSDRPDPHKPARRVRGPKLSRAAAVAPDRAMLRLLHRPARDPRLSPARTMTLLRRQIRHIFVIYQENRSFDSYFGTFPGAEGLFSHPAEETPGFTQRLLDTDGKAITIHPFRIGPKEYAADTDDVDHSHSAIVRKMHIVGRTARMDRFAEEEEKTHDKAGAGPPTLAAKQFGELAMAYMDGDTIPLLWRYANRFVLFDHIFQQMTGPSTPGNLAIIGAQSGATQWMRHPEQAYRGTGDKGPGVPVLNDALPFWGSPRDTLKAVPHPFLPPLSYGKRKTNYEIQENLTYATLPLALSGKAAHPSVSPDPHPADLADIHEDLGDLSRSGHSRVPWGWYQEGYDREPTDSGGADPVDAGGLHASYITHHNGPQYFGYIANSPAMSRSLHGLGDFFTALRRRSLPSRGVFYVKGGYRNIMKLKPADPNPDVQRTFRGDDDHPAYSDAQISEALVAEAVNRIARSPYWRHCAIIVTWDDSEGDYDHVPPPVRAVGPDGSVLTDGPRVPLLLISPYARVHAIVHDPGDHASVVKLIDRVFGLKPLADLPDEKEGRAIGERKGWPGQGPYDDLTPGITDLTSAFDPARLAGRAAPLPPAYALVPDRLVHTLPQQLGYGWRQVGVVPVDYRRHLLNPVPADFNPRPRTNPTLIR